MLEAFVLKFKSIAEVQLPVLIQKWYVSIYAHTHAHTPTHIIISSNKQRLRSPSHSNTKGFIYKFAPNSASASCVALGNDSGNGSRHTRHTNYRF